MGANFVLGAIDQNNILTTIRNAEFLGDSTPALALACARRRKDHATRSASQPVRLASSHRVVRLQPFDFPGYRPHFRLFGLVSAGRDTGSQESEVAHLREHLSFYLNLFRALNREGWRADSPLVELSDLRITERLLNAAGISREEVLVSVRAHKPGSAERFLEERGVRLPADVDDPRPFDSLIQLQERVVAPLQAAYPEAQFRFNLARLEGLGSYPGFCLRISRRLLMARGTPWPMAGLRTGRRDCWRTTRCGCLISGIGSEFVCARYVAAG